MLLKNFKIFKKKLKINSVEKKKKRIRSDRGYKYESSAFNLFVQTLGIIHETIAPYSLASNSMAERKI